MTTPHHEITICAQHLTGNDPEGLNVDVWVERLRREYRATALAHYPRAAVTVDIDVQEHTSGATREPTVVLETDGELDVDSDLEREVAGVSSWLWSRVCDDPTMWLPRA
jgi:hypothetical protein